MTPAIIHDQHKTAGRRAGKPVGRCDRHSPADHESQGRGHPLPVVGSHGFFLNATAFDAVASLVNLAGALHRSRHFSQFHDCSRFLPGEHMRARFLPRTTRKRPVRLHAGCVTGRTLFNAGHDLARQSSDGPESHNLEHLSSIAVAMSNRSERRKHDVGSYTQGLGNV